MKKQIVRLGITVAASGCLFIPALLGGAGCDATSSGPNGTPTSTSSASSAGAGGTSTSTSTGSTTTPTGDGGGEAGGGAGACPTDVLDDMSMAAGPNATGGYWYTYSDRTCVAAEPALIRADASGTLVPEEGQQFVAMDDGTGPNPCGTGPVPYRDFMGGGEGNWGAGAGFDFLDSPTQPAPFATCSPEMCTGMEAPDAYVPGAGDAGGGNAYAAPTDVSSHKGISFYIRAVGATTPVKVNVQLSDKTTNPGGGVCDECLYGGPALDGGTIRCADDWIETVTASSSWEQQTVKFADSSLKTGGWSTGNTPRPASKMDLTTLFYVHFQMSTNGAPPLKPFHLQIAYIGWVD